MYLCSMEIGIQPMTGREDQELQHIYDYADVYHCENIDKVTNEMVGI